MSLRREPCDLAAHDQVDVEVEPICFERHAIAFLHRAHFASHITGGLVERLGVHDRLARRLIIRQNQIVIDQCERRLSERKIA